MFSRFGGHSVTHLRFSGLRRTQTARSSPQNSQRFPIAESSDRGAVHRPGARAALLGWGPCWRQPEGAQSLWFCLQKSAPHILSAQTAAAIYVGEKGKFATQIAHLVQSLDT